MIITPGYREKLIFHMCYSLSHAIYTVPSKELASELYIFLERKFIVHSAIMHDRFGKNVQLTFHCTIPTIVVKFTNTWRCSKFILKSTITEKMAAVHFPGNALRSKVFKKANGCLLKDKRKARVWFVYSAKTSRH